MEAKMEVECKCISNFEWIEERSHRKFVGEMLTHYEKIMSIATNLSSCSIVLLDIFSCIRQVATNIIFS
jgi:hypothetical protein